MNCFGGLEAALECMSLCALDADDMLVRESRVLSEATAVGQCRVVRGKPGKGLPVGRGFSGGFADVDEPDYVHPLAIYKGGRGNISSSSVPRNARRSQRSRGLTLEMFPLREA